jgi:uncharacterized cupredoxin-like copper-binding protein
MRHSPLLFAVPFVLLLASACAPAAAPSAGPAFTREQVIVAGTDDFRFNPSTITLKARQPLQLTFENEGEILHDFTVQQGLAKPVMIVEEGGNAGTTTVSYDRAGTYKFFCSQPGHDQLGMHGTITVE